MKGFAIEAEKIESRVTGFGVARCVAAPAALIGPSNFFELAVAAAISLFGLTSCAASPP